MKQTADLVLYNGIIYTVDKDKSIVEAVAVKGETILATGSTDYILSLANDDTKKVDLQGNFMIPGLNDSHAHPFFLAMDIDNVDLISAKNIAEIQKLIRQRSQTIPEGNWVVSRMAWHETQLEENRFPTREELDQACPNHPVCLQRGGHVKVCNSMALEMAGITEDMEDPVGGHFGRNRQGRLNGLLADAASAMVDRVIPKNMGPGFAQAMKRVSDQLNQYGVTTTAEMGSLVPIHMVHENNFKTITSLYDKNEFHARMAAMIYAVDYDMAKWAVEFGSTFENNDHFKFQGIKLIQDGGVETANLIEPYEVIEEIQPIEDFHGISFWTEERKDEFRKIMDLCSDHKLMLQIHTYGDKSAQYNIDMYAEQGEKAEIGKLNWTICHLPLCNEEQLAKLKKYDICVSIQHQPYLLGLNLRRYWGEERGDIRNAEYRKLMDQGIRMGAGTDYPIGPVNPFPCIEFLVDRKIIDGSVLGAQSGINIEEAIYLWTQGSADIEGWGEMIGSIEPGKKADFAVLDQNLLTIPVENIHNTTVLQTWFNGECVYED
ncbi:MAG: amidohydrolase [Eubacteriales bacterium]|nr:amidohydrolase [Eubacteriales bacterium]